jgi:uncharacterized protein (UPF0262 family)
MIWGLRGAPNASLLMKNERKNKLTAVEIDSSIGTGSREAEQERDAAINDLLDSNSFALSQGTEGPYHLILAVQTGRLVFDVRDQAQNPISAFGLSLSPFRRVVTDYLQICESYYSAVRSGNPAQIETVDMARRGLHNEGSEILRDRLSGKVELDLDTARRLFTLVCALLWRSA